MYFQIFMTCGEIYWFFIFSVLASNLLNFKITVQLVSITKFFQLANVTLKRAGLQFVGSHAKTFPEKRSTLAKPSLSLTWIIAHKNQMFTEIYSTLSRSYFRIKFAQKRKRRLRRRWETVSLIRPMPMNEIECSETKFFSYPVIASSRSGTRWRRSSFIDTNIFS